MAVTPSSAIPKSEGIGLIVGMTTIIEVAIFGNAFETTENQRGMGVIHGLLAPGFVIANFNSNRDLSHSEKSGIWAAFTFLELMAAYNVIRPSVGEPEKLEILSVNIILPHCAVAALASFFMKEDAGKKRIIASLLPDKGGFSSSIMLRF